ncbi:hypothetical protein [Caminibacter pacificus]|uniref:Uncharacterized protein n=2 Tax=Caminibacter pacificus TaxID=1424653 RepID=A0AAJ4RCB5_9BACT|nr:hypothetical protein [Caminibacter pacificus]ROR39853.1 hypothetical protein EDC58_0829 [Caminibacter pacificus]
MKKKISLWVMGEKFELEMEEEFLEFAKEDLIKIQNPTPRDLLFFVLEKNKEKFETEKKLQSILKRLEKELN